MYSVDKLIFKSLLSNNQCIQSKKKKKKGGRFQIRSVIQHINVCKIQNIVK